MPVRLRAVVLFQKVWRHITVPQRIFANHTSPQELLEIVRAAGLDASARMSDAAEGLPANLCAGDTPVDIQISDPEAPSRQFDVRGQA